MTGARTTTRARAALAAAVTLGVALALTALATGPTSARWTDEVHARGLVAVVIPVAAVTEVTTGDSYACAVVEGRGWCWGNGQGGVLGDGTATSRMTPVAVGDGTDAMAGLTVTDIDASTRLTCAVAGARAFCWGASNLGDYDTFSPWMAGQQNAPVAVYDGTPATDPGPYAYDSPLAGVAVQDIDAGEWLSCAVGLPGTGACWGVVTGLSWPVPGPNPAWRDNAPIRIPTVGQDPLSQLPDGSALTRVSADFETGCVLAAGTGYCWGMNAEGQVGNGLTGVPEPAPHLVSAGQMGQGGVTDIAVAVFHACAASGGSAYCWGLRSSGAIGDGGGPNGSQTTPSAVLLPGGTTVTDVSTGGGSSCALTSDGEIWCWGSNSDGQLGSTSVPPGTTSELPVLVDRALMPPGVTFTAVSIGTRHTCAIGTDDQVYCWGLGTALGYVGASSTNRPQVPVTAAWAP
ncbi:RCC1 domain-containing protein [Cellulomonas sp. S1-8]|uniref:RCC1 domain-containing protein n=1 Tax=Cellulomonas sp. S1-8 TaxID=2904790 RepID=UPI00224432A7|nr:hypothetical protein [Cellulomonas sp. S1-8]UZN02971.1 hypothetical protein OKX07_18260 [Cellulomonas sp. S1-8]